MVLEWSKRRQGHIKDGHLVDKASQILDRYLPGFVRVSDRMYKAECPVCKDGYTMFFRVAESEEEENWRCFGCHSGVRLPALMDLIRRSLE